MKGKYICSLEQNNCLKHFSLNYKGVSTAPCRRLISGDRDDEDPARRRPRTRTSAETLTTDASTHETRVRLLSEEGTSDGK